MNQDERETADVAGYRIAHAFSPRAAREKLLLMLRDQVDMFLNMFLRHRPTLIAFLSKLPQQSPLS
jgi:hypothetical protein